jgi:hypothetical protein
MGEAARVLLRVDDEQVAASKQDKVDAHVNRLNIVRVRVLTHGCNKLAGRQRPKRAHHPLKCTFCHSGCAARLRADLSQQLIVRLLQVFRKPSEAGAHVALAPQFEQLAQL